MPGKKIRRSLDSLRGDIQELAESFATFRDQVATQQAAAAAERQSQTLWNGAGITTGDDAALPMGGIGHISMSGHFEARPESGQNQVYNWSLERMPIEEALAFSVDQHARRLAAIGHPQRLGIVLMLLDQPATANDVVTDLVLGTTGAAYHHLNVLQAAGFVEQQQRGVFTLVPGQISVLLTILTGLSDLMQVDITSAPADPPEEDVSTAPTEVTSTSRDAKTGELLGNSPA